MVGGWTLGTREQQEGREEQEEGRSEQEGQDMAGRNKGWTNERNSRGDVKPTYDLLDNFANTFLFCLTQGSTFFK
jgi:hypothetical protein